MCPTPRRRGLSLAWLCAWWAPRAAALLLAITLGLLSPLSCVIHCAILQLFVEPPAISHFLCGEPGAMRAVTSPAAHLPAAPTPRALYELLSPPTCVSVPTTVQFTTIAISTFVRPRPVALTPPTPPPRPSFA